MAGLRSHPLRITELDELKEESPESWFASFKGLHLHVRVGARRARGATSGRRRRPRRRRRRRHNITTASPQLNTLNAHTHTH